MSRADKLREIERLRSRLAELESHLELLQSLPESDSQALVVVAQPDNADPAIPDPYLACQAYEVGGTAEEGQAGSLAPMPAKLCSMFKLDRNVPTEGPQLVGTVDPAGRYVAHHNGGS